MIISQPRSRARLQVYMHQLHVALPIILVNGWVHACRPDETAESIAARGLQTAGASYRSQHPSGAVGGYFGSMCEHIKRGSHEKRRPFISATLDLSSAMHWSYAGVSTVVKIDLRACREQGIFYWDCCRDSFLLYGPMAANFGEASKEIVLDDNIPASCCSVLKVTMCCHPSTCLEWTLVTFGTHWLSAWPASTCYMLHCSWKSVSAALCKGCLIPTGRVGILSRHSKD